MHFFILINLVHVRFGTMFRDDVLGRNFIIICFGPIRFFLLTFHLSKINHNKISSENNVPKFRTRGHEKVSYGAFIFLLGHSWGARAIFFGGKKRHSETIWTVQKDFPVVFLVKLMKKIWSRKRKLWRPVAAVKLPCIARNLAKMPTTLVTRLLA